MVRNVDFNKIENVNTYVLKQLLILKGYQKNILNDINRINDGYKGFDSRDLIIKYTNRVNSLNTYIDYLERFCKFMGWLSNGYGEAYNKAKQQLDLMAIDDNKEPFDTSGIVFDMEKILDK